MRSMITYSVVQTVMTTESNLAARDEIGKPIVSPTLDEYLEVLESVEFTS